MAVNGEPVDDNGLKINPAKDKIALDNKIVRPRTVGYIYWLLYKPRDVSVPERRPSFQKHNDHAKIEALATDGRPSIYEMPGIRSERFGLRPLLPLDSQTEGALILTNDFDLIAEVRKAAPGISFELHVLLTTKLTVEELKEIGERKFGKIQLRISHAHGELLGATRGHWYVIKGSGVTPRIVRAAFKVAKKKVARCLVRTVAGSSLGMTQKVGAYRQLETQEIHQLKKISR